VKDLKNLGKGRANYSWAINRSGQPKEPAAVNIYYSRCLVEILPLLSIGGVPQLAIVLDPVR
jgi:hypothetical protein